MNPSIRNTIAGASVLGEFGASYAQIIAAFAPLDSIAASEGPATAWLRSNADAIEQIKRERLADEARENGA